jgi:hypothetical protein
LVGLERVTQDGTKIRAQASKCSFLDRKHLQQSLDLAKRHMANVDADNVDPLSQHQEAARYRVQREREAREHRALAPSNSAMHCRERLGGIVGLTDSYAHHQSLCCIGCELHIRS